MDTYKVYIQKDTNNHVVDINSSAFLIDLSNWIKVDEGIGDKYHHAQGNYLNKPITDNNGCHNYIYENSKVRETTDEEKATELSSFPVTEPTEAERLASAEKSIAILMGV